MTTAPVRYGEHARVDPGAPCLLCGPQSRRIVTDHCHAHGWVRGGICTRCNVLMAFIDRRISPRAASPLMTAALVAHASRCPDCQPFRAEDLGPAATLRPHRPRIPSQQKKLRLPSDLEALVQEHAERLGVSFNAAAIVLLREGLRAEARRTR